MKLALTALAAALSLAAGPGFADTRSSDQGRATMERKASPSNPVKQDEERTQAHSQPDTPQASSGASKAKPAKKSKKRDKASSSAGASRPAAMSAEQEQAFKALDLDGDGDISKAEAAGHAELVTGFDRADRDHDGKLSRAEYQNLGKAQAKKKQAAR